MKKIIMNDQNKLRKEIYIVLISVCLFVGAIFFSEKYLSEGEKKLVQLRDYNSVNSRRMTIKEIEALLLAQPEIISTLSCL